MGALYHIHGGFPGAKRIACAHTTPPPTEGRSWLAPQALQNSPLSEYTVDGTEDRKAVSWSLLAAMQKASASNRRRRR